MSDITHFNKLAGIQGLCVRGNDKELLVVDADGNFYQTGVKVDLVQIEADVAEIKTIVEDTNTVVDSIKVITEDTQDKVGLPTDIWVVDQTLLGYTNNTYKHIHNPSYVYPVDCSLIDVVTSATANTFGDFVEVIPANGITVAFDIHWANIQDVSANGTYIIELHEVSNADLQIPEKFLGSFSISRQNSFTRSFQVSVQIPVIAPNKRVGVRAKKSVGMAGTVSFNVMYHDYE